ncbi:ArsR family transcriptional regulator [Candidatus Woesearchaeota archaeon]|nr:ArsR family transcriptional regulator [Candidatus Woesearchaeota archaeon]
MVIIQSRKITVVKISRPLKKDINEELQWIGTSLGLFGLRDKDKSCFRVFIELLKAAKAREPLSSDEIADRLGLTRGTVIHHINKLMESGLVTKVKNKYMLRVENMEDLIDELRRDFERAYHNLKQVAIDVDRSLGL